MLTFTCILPTHPGVSGRERCRLIGLAYAYTRA